MSRNIYVSRHKLVVGPLAERIGIMCAGMTAAICPLGVRTPPTIVAVSIGYVVPIPLRIALVGQWLVALLVPARRQRLNAAFDEAERRRRLVDIVSHENGASLTAIAGKSRRLAQLCAPPVLEYLKIRVGKNRKASGRIQHEKMVERIRLAALFDNETFSIDRRAVDVRTIRRPVVEELREKNDGLDKEVDISSRKMDQHTMIDVTDRGRHIPPHDISRICALYNSGANAERVSGTAVGLYTSCKKLSAPTASA